MNTLKSIGGILFGLIAFVALVATTILIFTVGSQIAFKIAPLVNGLAATLFFINVVALIAAIAPGARTVAGYIILSSSFAYGLAAWIYGLAVTLSLWGWIAVIIGVFLGGIGVVPIGMLAAVFNAEWGAFWTLTATVALTFIARIVGALLVASADAQVPQRKVIDAEPIAPKRTWNDIDS